MLKTPSFHIDGKNVLVVGASSGIGQACAVALAQYGGDVTIVARGEKGLRQTRDMINEYGKKATIHNMDITNVKETEDWLAAQQPFDILVNAAGIARHSPAIETTPSDFDDVCNINLKSAYFLTRAVAKPLIKANRQGSLINISSQMGHIGGIDRTVYAATKHAIEGMTKSMAIEWGKYNIRVNTICPTFVRTPLAQQTFDNPERVAWIKDKIKLDRIAEVEDIMGVVVFLASDASAMITGSAIMVDGGWTAG